MYDLAHFLLENNVKIVILVKVNAQGTTRCSQNKHPLTMNNVLFTTPTLKMLHHKKHWQISLSIIKNILKNVCFSKSLPFPENKFQWIMCLLNVLIFFVVGGLLWVHSYKIGVQIRLIMFIHPKVVSNVHVFEVNIQTFKKVVFFGSKFYLFVYSLSKHLTW